MLKTILITILLSFLPISELRGALPFAYINGLKLWQAFALSSFCNMLVAPFGFVFFSTIHKLLDKWSLYHKFITSFIEKAQKKVGPKINKYGLWGLMVFVAIPLPITGAWTGTVAAWFLNLDRKKSILSICLGVLIAACIVSAVVITGAGIGSLFTKTINL